MKLELLLMNDAGRPTFALVLRPAPAAGGVVCPVGRAAADAAGKPAWSTFEPDAAFVEALTSYLAGGARVLPELDGCQVAPGENVHLIDERSPDVDGDVPFQDLVGMYRTDPRGFPVLASFQHNADHLLVDASGNFSSWLGNEGFLAFLRGRAS